MKRLLLCAMMACLLAATGCVMRNGARDPQIAFRYAENQAADYPTTLAAEYFAERVEALSGGRIHILVYPDAALGDERSVVEQIQYGGVDFSRISISLLAEFDERLTALQLPYLYQDGGHMWRVLDGEIGGAYLQSMLDIDLVGLAWMDAGARHFYTQTPVRKLADMQGLRIRVQENAMMERMVALLGAVPTKMRYSDVLPALQTGKIDGAENNYPSYESTGHYLVAQYLLEDEHTRIPEVMVASRAVMERLQESDRALIAQAAQEAAAYQRELWQEYEARTRAAVVESGCEIYVMPAAEKARFQDAMQSIYDEHACSAGDVLAEIEALRE